MSEFDRPEGLPEASPPGTWDERILRALPSGVDVTQIEENLKLTPTERLERLQEALSSLEGALAA